MIIKKNNKKNLFLFLSYPLIIFLVVLYRLTLGVGYSDKIFFGDESYYASFIDGWLKLGIGHNYNLMIHQTASWLIYPFSLFYRWLMGDLTGIILFFRILYLALSFLAAISFFCLGKRITSITNTTLVSLMIFLFIPFSLPTISYNTLGMLGLLIALCLFAIVILDLNKKIHWSAFWGSAIFGSIAIIAYPSLIFAALFFLILTYFLLPSMEERLVLFRYGLAAIFCLITLGILLCLTLGLPHVLEMASFTNELNQVSNLSQKWKLAKSFLLSSPQFFLLTITGLILALFKAFYFKNNSLRWFNYIFFGNIIYFCLVSKPILFLNSHDFLFIMALAGIYIPLQNLNRNRFPSIINILYLTSLMAGLVTTATATYSLFNFCIGSLLAASLSILLINQNSKFSNQKKEHQYNQFIFILFLISSHLVMLFSSYSLLYGEEIHPLKAPSVRISEGIFAGLLTTLEKSKTIQDINNILPQNIYDKSLTVFGNQGCYLLTSLTPKSLATWDGKINDNNRVITFFKDKKNLPDFILEVTDYFNPPLNKAYKDLLEQYRLKKKLSNERIKLQLYELSV